VTDIDTVRLLIGDTEATEVLSDADISSLLDDRSVLDDDGGTVSVNVPAAAADAAGALAAKYAKDFSFAEDGQRFDRAQRVGHYLSIERDLRNRSGGFAVAMGGTVSTT
jgi:hypothetical protein